MRGQKEEEKAVWLKEIGLGETDYHERQIENTYRSTVVFCNWLESLGLLSTNCSFKIADVGAGQGANIFYMAKRYENSSFIGIDLNPDLVRKGNDYFKKAGRANCQLVEGDLYNLCKDHAGKYNGITSYQTLSWLPEFETPIIKMIELDPEWIAMSSLFYDGDLNTTIVIQDYGTPFGGKPFRESYYNVYSLPLIRKLFEKYGYRDFKYIPFEIDIDIQKPEKKGLGTYTEKLENGKRMQISGPLLMPWYFIAALK